MTRRAAKAQAADLSPEHRRARISELAASTKRDQSELARLRRVERRERKAQGEG